MTRVCYLHAGTHRTGSTAIQVALARNAQVLLEHGLFVPRTGALDARGGHHNVALELNGSPRFDPSLGSFAELTAEISASRSDRAIVSSEIFQQLHAKPAALRRFVAGMSEIGYETRAVLFLRSQASYAESVYAVYAEMGYALDFAFLVDGIVRDGALGAGTENVFALSYFELLEGFADVVGRKRVLARPYGPGGTRSSLFDDILELTIGRTSRRIEGLAPFDRQNVSRPIETLLAASEGDAVPDAALSASRGGILLPGEALRFVRRFSAGNRRVRREYGVRIESVPRRELAACALAAVGLNPAKRNRRRKVDALVHAAQLRRSPPVAPSLGDPMLDTDDSEVATLLRSLAAERERHAELSAAARAVRASKFSILREVSSTVRSFAHPPAATLEPLVRAAAPAPDLRGHERAEWEFETDDAAYACWRAKHVPRAADLRLMARNIGRFSILPKVSILVATYNTNPTYLAAAVESVRAQIYPYWELCIADDASTLPHVRDWLIEAAALDPRITFTLRRSNGNISEATNSALDIASGEFVALLDHDDVLAPAALYEVVRALQDDASIDVFYSDEDKLGENGKLFEPHFKPDYCPDSLLSRNYLSHFGVYRRSVVEAAGRMRKRFDGSQDYDLALRVVERTHRIHHIPAILYHWRSHDDSTAKRPESKAYAFEAARAAIAETLDRRGEPGTVTAVAGVPGTYIVRYRIHSKGRVTIVIPTRDHAEDLERCLASIFAHPSSIDFEVFVVDNGSTEASAFQTFAKWRARDPRITVERCDVPFNFSAINNFAVAKTAGTYLLFLNNDTEVLTPDWLEAMVEQAQRPTIGAVGARLLYEDGTIQHAGVILGIGGVAGHSHKYFAQDSHGYFMMLDAINNYSAVTGAALMVRRSVFEEAGRFDERLAVAFNDVDLCLRIGALGYRNVALPHVRLFHHESKSRGAETTPERQTRFAAEIAFMERRWNTSTLHDPCYSEHLTRVTEDFAIRDWS